VTETGVGSRLRDLRRRKGFNSAGSLSERLSVVLVERGYVPRSAASILAYETGKYDPPSEVREALITILGPDVQELWVDDFSGVVKRPMFPSVDAAHLRRVLDRYAGQYILYRQAVRTGEVTTVWLDIEEKQTNEGYGKVSSWQKTGEGIPLQGSGIVLPSENHLNLVGWRHGVRQRPTPNMEMVKLFLIKDEQPFEYLHGIVLSASYPGAIFAAKCACRRLQSNAKIEEFQEKIGHFSWEEVEFATKSLRDVFSNETKEGDVLRLDKT